MSLQTHRSEDLIGKQWDKFISNSVLKMGTGALIGSVFSLLVFRRRVWPLLFGSGVGLGFAANQLQTDLKQLNR